MFFQYFFCPFVVDLNPLFAKVKTYFKLFLEFLFFVKLHWSTNSDLYLFPKQNRPK